MRWIANDIKKREIVDAVIIAPIRGGLVPAVILSHKTGFPVRTCQYQRIDGDDRTPVVYGLDKSYTNIILIDDIVDSGITMMALDTQMTLTCPLSATHKYALVGRTRMIDTSVRCARRNDDWVKFCWEK